MKSIEYFTNRIICNDCLNGLLEFERERVQKMEEENKSLREEIAVLKSAFRSVYRD